LSATQQYLETDIVYDAIKVVDGHIIRPNGPGLGVEVDEAVLGVFCCGNRYTRLQP